MTRFMFGWSSQLTAQHSHATARRIKPLTYRSLILLLILSCAWGIFGIHTALDASEIHVVVGAGIVGVASLLLLLILCVANHVNHLQYIATAAGASSLIAGLTVHVVGEKQWSEGEPILVHLPIAVFVYYCLPVSLIIKCILVVSFLMLHVLVAIIFLIRDELELSVIDIVLLVVAVIVNISCLWSTYCHEVYSRVTFATLGENLHLRQQVNVEEELIEKLELRGQHKEASRPLIITVVQLTGSSGMPPDDIIQNICTKLTKTLTEQKMRISGNCMLLLGSCDNISEHVKACTYLYHASLTDIRCTIAIHFQAVSCVNCLLPAQLLSAETAAMQLAGYSDKLIISNSVFELLSTDDFYINGPKGEEPVMYYEITNVKSGSDSSLVLSTLFTTNESKLWKMLERRSHYIAKDYTPKLETIFDNKDASPFVIMYPQMPSLSRTSPRVTSSTNNLNNLLTNTNWDMRGAYYIAQYYPLFNWFTLHLLMANPTDKEKERPSILRNTAALHMIMILLLTFMVTFLRCVESWPTWYLIMLMVAVLSIVLLTMVAYLVFIYRYNRHVLLVDWTVFIILNITALMLIGIPSHNNENLSNCIDDVMCMLTLLMVPFLPIRYWLVKSTMISAISVGYTIYSRSENDPHHCDIGLISILWSTLLLIMCQRDSHLSINLLLAAHQLHHNQCNVVHETRIRCNQLLLTLVPSHVLPLLGQYHCFVKSHANAGLLIIEHDDCNEFKKESAKLMEKYTNLSLCISEMKYTVVMSGKQYLTQLLNLSVDIVNTVDTPIKMAMHCGTIFEALLGVHYQLCGNIVNECQNILLIVETGQILLTGDVYKLTEQMSIAKLFDTRQILDTELMLYSIRRQVAIQWFA